MKVARPATANNEAGRAGADKESANETADLGAPAPRRKARSRNLPGRCRISGPARFRLGAVMNEPIIERAGIIAYILVAICALLCCAWIAASEVLVLQQDTNTHIALIEQAVDKLEKVARK